MIILQIVQNQSIGSVHACQLKQRDLPRFSTWHDKIFAHPTSVSLAALQQLRLQSARNFAVQPLRPSGQFTTGVSFCNDAQPKHCNALFQ